jgi:hypothetical protein
MHRTSLAVALASLFAFSGITACSKEQGSTEKDTKAQETPPQPGAAAEGTATEQSKAGKTDKTAHAPPDVVPGSHEDWCDEHQVPESQCTRCNADLIAAFKATGDWCEEHGLPESQCLKCNPELKIVRPPPGAAPKAN